MTKVTAIPANLSIAQKQCSSVGLEPETGLSVPTYINTKRGDTMSNETKGQIVLLGLVALACFMTVAAIVLH